MELKAFVHKHAKRLTKYAIVGTTGFFVDAAVLYGLTTFLHIWYIESELFATIVAFVSNYIGNTIWTYRDAMKKLEEANRNESTVTTPILTAMHDCTGQLTDTEQES